MGDESVVTGLVGFTHALRRAGLACHAQRVHAYLQAVEHVDPADPDDLYWAGRLTLCSQPDDLPRYDTAFAAWFLPGAPQPRIPGIPNRQRRTVLASLRDDPPAGSDEGAEDAPTLRVAASAVEVLRHRDLAELSAAEREQLRELFALLRIEPPTRRAARYSPSRRGALDPRRTLRALLAGGGEPVRLHRHDLGRRRRRVVLLVDVSGSMRPYADALLRFAHVLARRGDVEVFTLGTRLTRITRQLTHADPEIALTAAARAVPDFAGGTRLGDGLRAFLDRWGQRGLARRAVVVLFSDGWERGDPTLLAEQVARLRRLAHAVLWSNPHAGRPGYRPVQAGMAAALPHVDRLLAGHSLASLEALLAEVRNA